MVDDPMETTARLDVDFSDPAVINDPFPVYEEIRAAGHVVWNDLLPGWMVPHYDDVVEVFMDPGGARFAILGAEVFFWFDAPTMITIDGSEHHRLRRPLAKYFAPAEVIRTWEPRVREVVDDLLAPLAERSEAFDLVDFTKIPVIIVAEMFGVPPEHHEDFRRWSNTIVSNIQFGHENPDARREMEQAVTELKQYLAEEIERHRRQPRDDVLGIMLDIPGWTDEEIWSTAILLLLAGYDTTAKLMSNCLWALEQHPDQRRVLVEEPALIPNAIEEVLRWVGSTQATVRRVTHDTVLAGTQLRTDEIVYTMLIAANRDPSRWDDPQRFDVRRPYKPNLGFATGPHICLGAPLARLETKVAVEALLRIAPEYHLRDLDYGNAFFARGAEHGLIEATTPALGPMAP
jgi:cytochrome P450